MTLDERLKSVADERKPSTGNVREFTPRMPAGALRTKEPVSGSRSVPKAHVATGNDDDPGPTAA